MATFVDVQQSGEIWINYLIIIGVVEDELDMLQAEVARINRHIEKTQQAMEQLQSSIHLRQEQGGQTGGLERLLQEQTKELNQHNQRLTEFQESIHAKEVELANNIYRSTAARTLAHARAHAFNFPNPRVVNSISELRMACLVGRWTGIRRDWTMGFDVDVHNLPIVTNLLELFNDNITLLDPDGNPCPWNPTADQSANPNPGNPIADQSANPKPEDPTADQSANPNPGNPTADQSANPKPEDPTADQSANPKPEDPTADQSAAGNVLAVSTGNVLLSGGPQTRANGTGGTPT